MRRFSETLPERALAASFRTPTGAAVDCTSQQIISHAQLPTPQAASPEAPAAPVTFSRRDMVSAITESDLFCGYALVFPS